MESTRSLMEQSEGLMAVVVLKFLGFLADVKGKEIFFTTETNRFSVEKGFFFTSWIKSCIISPVPFQSGLFDLSKHAKSL